MAKAKRYFYLVDNLTPKNGAILKRGLQTVSIITGVGVDVRKGVIEVTATKNPEVNVRAACNDAGAPLRRKIKKKLL